MDFLDKALKETATTTRQPSTSLDQMLRETAPQLSTEEKTSDFLGNIQLGAKQFGKAALALGETAATMITGAVGVGAGVLAGLPALTFGEPEVARNILERTAGAITYHPQTELAQQVVGPPMEALGRGISGFAKEVVSMPFPSPLTGKYVRLKDVVPGAQAAAEYLTQAALVLAPFFRGHGKVVPQKNVLTAELATRMAERAKAERLSPEEAAIREHEVFIKEKFPEATREPVEAAPKPMEPKIPDTQALTEAEQLSIRKRRQAEEEARFTYQVPKEELPVTPQVTTAETPLSPVAESRIAASPVKTGWRKTPYGGYSNQSIEQIIATSKQLEKGGAKVDWSVLQEELKATDIPKPKGKKPDALDRVLAEDAPAKPIGPLKDAQVKDILRKILADESGLLRKEFLDSLSDATVKRAIDPYVVVYEAVLPRLRYLKEAPIAEIRKEAQHNSAIAWYDPQTRGIKISKQGENCGGLIPKYVDAAEQLRQLKHEFGWHFIEDVMDYMNFADFLEASRSLQLDLPYKFLAEYWSPDPRKYRDVPRTAAASERIATVFESTSPREWAHLVRATLEKVLANPRRPMTPTTRAEYVAQWHRLKTIENNMDELRPAFRDKDTGKILEYPGAKTHREVLQFKEPPAEPLWNVPAEWGIEAPGVRYDGPFKKQDGTLALHGFTDQATRSSFSLTPEEFAKGKEFYIHKKVDELRKTWKEAEKHEFVTGAPSNLEYGWLTKEGRYFRRFEEAFVSNNNSKLTIPESTLENVKKLAVIVEDNKEILPERRVALQEELLRIGDMGKEAEGYLKALSPEELAELKKANRMSATWPVERVAHLARRASENVPHEPITKSAWDIPSLENRVRDWLIGKTSTPPKPTLLYRGIPKEAVPSIESTTGFTHVTPWESVAKRAGKGAFGDPRTTTVLEYPISEPPLFYRGGALAGDPLERTKILSSQGMSWEQLLSETKALYDAIIKEDLRRIYRQSKQVDPTVLEAAQLRAANEAISNLISASFETDLSGKPGIWVGKELIPKELHKEHPNLRSNTELKRMLSNNLHRGIPKEILLDTPEAKILQRQKFNVEEFLTQEEKIRGPLSKLTEERGELTLRSRKWDDIDGGSKSLRSFWLMRGGKEVGELYLKYDRFSKELEVDYITTYGHGMPNVEKLGFRDLNSLRKEIMAQYPEAEVVTGIRISGMAKDSITPLRIPLKSMLKSERGAVSLEALKDLSKSVAEFFVPTFGLPRSKEYLAARYSTLGKLNIVENSVKKTWQELKRLDQNIKRDIFRFLDGQISLSTLPPNVQPIARRLQIQNDSIGKMLVKRGMLSQEAFDKHKGQYIRYMYLKHILGDEKPISTSGGRLDLKYLKERKDLTSEQRKALGLIEDVSVAEPMTLSKSLSDIVKWDLFDKISKEPDWTWQPSIIKVGGRQLSIRALQSELEAYRRVNAKTPNVPEIQQVIQQMEGVLASAIKSVGKPPKDYYPIPDSKSYGPLRGAYVHKSIADDILPIFGGVAGKTPGAGYFNLLVALEERSMAAFKISKVAFNVPTMTRNMVSNIIQLNMSGMNLGKVIYYMEQAALSALRKDVNFMQARRQGVFKTNWAEGEIAEVLRTVKDYKPKSWYDLVDHIAPLAKFYGRIDDFFKLAKYLEGKGKGLSTVNAALEAQKWGMDYSLASPSVKLARRHIVPFGTYSYKITPLIAEAMVKRPWVIAKYAALIPLSYELFRQTNDIDEATWNKLYKQLPSYIKRTGSYAVLPVKNAEGNWQWINLEYFFPWQNMRGAMENIIEERYGELPQDIGITNPYFTILASLAASKGGNPPIDMWTGQPIFNRVDPSRIKAQKMTEWLYSQWAPPMLTRMGALGYTFSIGDVTKTGHKITPEEAALRWFGVNINTVTPTQYAKEIRGKRSLLLRDLQKIIRDPSVDPARRLEAVQEYRKLTKELLMD